MSSCAGIARPRSGARSWRATAPAASGRRSSAWRTRSPAARSSCARGGFRRVTTARLQRSLGGARAPAWKTPSQALRWTNIGPVAYSIDGAAAPKRGEPYQDVNVTRSGKRHQHVRKGWKSGRAQARSTTALAEGIVLRSLRSSHVSLNSSTAVLRLACPDVQTGKPQPDGRSRRERDRTVTTVAWDGALGAPGRARSRTPRSANETGSECPCANSRGTKRTASNGTRST